MAARHAATSPAPARGSVWQRSILWGRPRAAILICLTGALYSTTSHNLFVILLGALLTWRGVAGAVRLALKTNGVVVPQKHGGQIPPRPVVQAEVDTDEIPLPDLTPRGCHDAKQAGLSPL